MISEHWFRCETIFSPPRYLHPGVKISLRYFHPLHDIFTPHYKWWNKLLFSDIIQSHNVPLQSGIFFILSMAFYSFQTVLTQYLNLSTNTEILSFNSKEDSMLKCEFYGLNMNIYIIKQLGIFFPLQSQMWGVKIFKYNHPQCQILGEWKYNVTI